MSLTQTLSFHMVREEPFLLSAEAGNQDLRVFEVDNYFFALNIILRLYLYIFVVYNI